MTEAGDAVPTTDIPAGASQRLFFALWPPAPVRRALVELQRTLPAGGRCAHPLDLHLTLVFVGVVEADRRPCVEAAGDDLHQARFELALQQIGHWPGPRIRWCRPDLAPAALIGLVEALQGRLRACGIAPEPRPYRPHVTLARTAPALVAQRLPAPVHWPVADFVLAASGANGTPRYQVLRRWPLV